MYLIRVKWNAAKSMCMCIIFIYRSDLFPETLENTGEKNPEGRKDSTVNMICEPCL